MVATYAIDAKKRKAQSQYPLAPLDRIAQEDALRRVGKFQYLPQAGPGTEEAAAFVRSFVGDPALHAVTPTEDQQEALFTSLERCIDRSAVLSLFLQWRGARGLLELALSGGRYGTDMTKSPPYGVLVKGSAPQTGWELTRVVLFVLAADRSLAPWANEQLQRAALPLVDRSTFASLLDDSAWANTLIDEWLAQPAIGATAKMDTDAVGLLGATDDDDRFRKFFERAAGKLQWAGRNALLARSLDRISADTLVDVLVPFMEGGLAKKWKSSQVEPYAKTLAHVRSPDVARVLALWLGEKSIAKVATEYFRAHPDLAPTALEPVASGKGKAAPIARAVLASIDRVEGSPSGAVDAGEAAAPKARAPRAAKAKKSAEPAPSIALPAALVSPPWLSKRKPERPRLALSLIADEERYAIAAKPTLHDPKANRSPEEDLTILGGKAPEEIKEHAIMGLTDELALRALAGRTRLQLWGLMDSFFAWLGPPVVPHLMRLLAAELDRGAHTMLARAVSPRLALACARLALSRSGGAARNDAMAWLRAHPTAAALGLVPAALGEDEADADVAERALRALLRAGEEQAVSAAAARYGADAMAALERLLTRSPHERFPAKMPPKAKWAAPERLGALELADGGALTSEHAAALIQMLQISSIGEPYQGAVEVTALLTPESRARFAQALLEEYLLAGSPPSHEWVIGALAVLAPEVAIRRLGAQMRAWAADGKVPLLHRSLEALAAIGTDEALVVVYDAGQRSRYDDTREKVRDILEDVARARELSYEVLEDVLVPELGLEQGAVELDLGARKLTVALGDHLEARLHGDGKPLASFPRKAKSDDPDLYAKAKARFAALVEAADGVGRGQVLRFERALRAQRTWRVAELRGLVLPQPLVGHLARRLVWQVLETGQLFRVAEDLTLADASDEALAFPPDEARVVLAHPLRADGLAAFATWLEDYQVIQPFAQVQRETFALESAERGEPTIRRVEGRKASYLSVLALTLGMDWKPIPPGDRGIDAITRALSDGRVARLGIRPGLLFGGAQGRPEQTLGALTVTASGGEPATFDDLDPLELSELLRDVLQLGS